VEEAIRGASFLRENMNLEVIFSTRLHFPLGSLASGNPGRPRGEKLIIIVSMLNI